MQKLPPVTAALLIANVLVFLLLQDGGHGDAALIARFALWPLGEDLQGIDVGFHVWQLVTYGFLHGGVEHIFFNMFALWMFGAPVETALGSRRFTQFYFACVVGAACAQLAVMALFQPGEFYPTVGASGGVFGLLLAFAMFYPQARLALFFVPIPVPAPLFVAGYVIIELVLGVTGTQAGVAHFAHLGGALVGFVLIRAWRSGANIP
jgi:membrane associated rhomboid family serine protease